MNAIKKGIFVYNSLILSNLFDIALQISTGKTTLYSNNDYGTIGAFDYIIQGINNTNEAFEILQELVNRIRDSKDKQTSIYFELVYSLSEASDTTEIPEGLLELINRNSKLDIIKTLKKWYRIT